MSVLRSLENKIAGLVEGTFSRAFRSEVRPVEIARKLAREMEEHKSVSVSRTYVPNEYRVFLSPARPRALRRLRGRAGRGARRLPARARAPRAAGAALAPGRRVPDRRAPGARRVRDPGPARAPPEGQEDPTQRPAEQSGHTMVYSTAERVAEPLEERARAARRSGAARARRQAHGGRAGRRDARPQPRLRHRPRRPQRLAPARRDTPARAARGCYATSARPTASRSTAAASTAPRCSSRGTRSSSGPSTMTFELE